MVQLVEYDEKYKLQISLNFQRCYFFDPVIK